MHVFASVIASKGRNVGEAAWGKWVPGALESGALNAKPDPVVGGKGLDGIQDALDMQKKGVSLAKVVVEL